MSTHYSLPPVDGDEWMTLTRALILARSASAANADASSGEDRDYWAQQAVATHSLLCRFQAEREECSPRQLRWA